ncbi:MAG TPA: PilN domain-containing protein [Candidatus Eisenbacteria bacterium]|nr:PilN domain-containing protein [Candidatus Eisenbacteria bacterium]
MAFKGLSLGLVPKNANQDIVGIDLSEERLKIVHVHATQLRREVAGLASHEVRGLSEEDVAALIKKTLAGFGLGANARAFLTIPLNYIITRTIEIPSRDPAEIREIVNLQASRHTPYSRSEIIIDLMNLGTVRDSYTKVLLVIVPKDVVVRQIRILETVPLRLEKVFFAPEGVCQACSKILGDADEAVTGIVHMDETFTMFQVVQRGRILFIRGISIGAGQLLDEKDIYADRFVEELEKSLESYIGDELGPMPSKLILTGVLSDTSDLDDLFTETLHIPLKKQAYYNYFAISAPARQTAQSARRVSFFDVIASTLLFDRMKVDLTSDERKLKLQLEQRGRQMVVTGVLTMLVLSLLFAVCLSKIYFRGAYLTKLTARYRPALEEAKSLELAYAKTQAVKDHLATRGRSIGALTELYDTLPRDVRLADIKYEEGQKFSVKGTSSTMASVFAFVTNLERSNQFKSVKTKYVNSRNENGADVADFEITAQIEKPAAAGPSR